MSDLRIKKNGCSYSDSVESFVNDYLLSRPMGDSWHSRNLTIEDKINRLADCMGNLLDKLLEKNLLTHRDFFAVLDGEYRSDHLASEHTIFKEED